MNIRIETENDAFAELPGAEVARILREYADKLDANPYVIPAPVTLRDRFGNTVGTVTP